MIVLLCNIYNIIIVLQYSFLKWKYLLTVAKYFVGGKNYGKRRKL